MKTFQPKTRDPWPNQRGFTLPEILVTIVIMGILLSLATSSWFGLIENRRVTSATNQVVADLRLAHSSATNRLGTASLSFDDVVSGGGLTVTCNGVSGKDYCLVKPTGTGTYQGIGRDLPDGTRMSSLNMISPGSGPANLSGIITGADRTVYFDSNGAARAGGSASIPVSLGSCPSGTPAGPTLVVAAEDNDPRHCLTYNTATSKVEID